MQSVDHPQIFAHNPRIIYLTLRGYIIIIRITFSADGYLFISVDDPDRFSILYLNKKNIYLCSTDEVSMLKDKVGCQIPANAY